MPFHLHSCDQPLPLLLLSSQDHYVKKKGKWLKPLFEWIQAHGNEPIIPFSGAYENEVRLPACVCVCTCACR